MTQQAVIARANQEYSAQSIRILEGLEGLRVRPGMYIGSNDTQEARLDLAVAETRKHPAVTKALALQGSLIPSEVQLLNHDGFA